MKPDWPAALGLGATGAIPAGLSILQLYEDRVEFLLWTALAAAVWIPVIVRRDPPLPVLTLTIAGLVAGIITGALQSALAHVMFARNAELAASFGGAATPLIRLELLVVGLVVGLCYGVLLGVIAEFLARRRRRAAAA